MYKILVACGAGIGSSMIMKRNVESFLDEAGVKYEITHESIGTAKSTANQFDLIFTLKSMLGHFSNVPDQSKVIGLKNVVAKDEIEEAIKNFLSTN